MSDVNVPQGIENTFFRYDDEARKTINDDACKLLNQLQQRFGVVEISDLREYGGAWCVRIQSTDNIGDPLPLAALGNNLEEAAHRLWRISTFF